MRKQYHFRLTGTDTLIWDIDRLIELSRSLPRIVVRLDALHELDESYWFESTGDAPTCRAVAGHARLIQEADLAYPIILSSDGRVMDGMHRVAKALLENRVEIDAVQFEHDPEPDYVNRKASELPY